MDSFLNELKKLHPNLSFTYETSKKKINFLDLNVSLKNGAISTDLYVKLTNEHQYLHYKSSHPKHIKKFDTVWPSVKVEQNFFIREGF